LKKLAGLLILLCACKSSAPPVEPPTWTQIPGALLDSLCAKLQNEGITPDNIGIVQTTQPLVTGASLRSVAHNYGKDAEVGALAQVITSSTPSIPLAVKEARCAWHPIAKLDPVRYHDRMIVEISAPIANPFARNEAGVLARMSLGGQNSQWYWIPLGQKNGQWAIGIVLPLDMHE